LSLQIHIQQYIMQNTSKYVMPLSQNTVLVFKCLSFALFIDAY